MGAPCKSPVVTDTGTGFAWFSVYIQILPAIRFYRHKPYFVYCKYFVPNKLGRFRYLLIRQRFKNELSDNDLQALLSDIKYSLIKSIRLNYSVFMHGIMLMMKRAAADSILHLYLHNASKPTDSAV
jgi:hypothetical protein